MAQDESGFLSRWAKRKELVRSGQPVAPEPAAPVAVVPTAPAPMPPRSPVDAAALAPLAPEAARVAVPQAAPLPTMADVALLTRDSDYSRFVGAGVDNGVNQAAMKKLFADPHFNVMDGLDTYIDDYGKPDPIPLAMLRQMNQSKFLRLFDDDEDEQKPKTAEALPPNPETDLKIARDDDPDLRLQQDDAARRPGPDPGAGA